MGSSPQVFHSFSLPETSRRKSCDQPPCHCSRYTICDHNFGLLTKYVRRNIDISHLCELQNECIIALNAKRTTPPLDFPPGDVADNLVDLCFLKVMPFFPVLHRPTFDRQRRSGLHRQDSTFARLYLIVCAIGANFSDDPHVFALSANYNLPRGSAGWYWFSQLTPFDRESTGAQRLGGLMSSVQ
jgi:hypothetical protein